MLKYNINKRSITTDTVNYFFQQIEKGSYIPKPCEQSLVLRCLFQSYQREVLHLPFNIFQNRWLLAEQMKRIYYKLCFESALQYLILLPSLQDKWDCFLSSCPLLIDIAASKLASRLLFHLMDAKTILYWSNLHASMFAFRFSEESTFEDVVNRILFLTTH